MVSFERGTLVIVTHNRRTRLLQTLRGLEQQAPEGWPIIVVDNGSTDGSAEAVRSEFPSAMLVRSRRNLGASAARNIAVAFVHTPYVAFCDEVTRWHPGALEQAAKLMDEHPSIGIVNGCVLLPETGQVDPECAALARSPLEQEGLPGPQLLDFMVGASLVRTRAFYEAGGFWPPLFAGGEELLLGLDLADMGWHIVYMEEIRLFRAFGAPAPSSKLPLREVRNAIWVAWMRLPVRQAWRETKAYLSAAAQRRQLRSVLVWTLGGLLRVMKERHVVNPRVAAMRARLLAQTLSDQSARTRARNSMA